MRTPFKVGLTGGLASGKSTVARRLAETGADVADADAIVRDLYRPGHPGARAVEELFGADYLTAEGAVDARQVAARVFHDADARLRLEHAIHPLVRDEFRRHVERTSPAIAVMEATRLVEAGFAPDFDLVGPDGKPGKLSDYRGKSVVLNFWATWCTPCKMEMPNLARTHTAFASQLTVLGVSSEETPGTVQAFLGQNPLPFPILLDQNGDVSRQYRVRGLPTTFFINPEGIVLDQKGGAFTNPAQLQPYIDRLLASVQP